MRLLGWRDDLPEIMSCSDWFILPHPEHPVEGFGLAVVEAQLAGLRMLLSRGIPDDPLLSTASFRRLALSEGPKVWAKAAMELLALSGAVTCRCARCAPGIANGHGPGARRAAAAAHMKCARPVRVLQIIDSLGMGGAETWLMEVLRLWSKSGVCRIDFLATSGNPGIFDDEARQLGRTAPLCALWTRSSCAICHANSAGCCGKANTTPSTITRLREWMAFPYGEVRYHPCA